MFYTIRGPQHISTGGAAIEGMLGLGPGLTSGVTGVANIACFVLMACAFLNKLDASRIQSYKALLAF
jgi:hypothetical protein